MTARGRILGDIQDLFDRAIESEVNPKLLEHLKQETLRRVDAFTTEQIGLQRDMAAELEAAKDLALNNYEKALDEGRRAIGDEVKALEDEATDAMNERDRLRGIIRAVVGELRMRINQAKEIDENWITVNGLSELARQLDEGLVEIP